MVDFRAEQIVDSKDDVEILGVAVTVADKYAHTALTYRSDDGEFYFLDMQASHVGNNVFDEKRHSKYLHAIPKLSDLELQAIADALAVEGPYLVDEPPPYGLRYVAGTAYDAEIHRFRFPKGCTGITCSGFVLGLLEAYKVKLLDMDRWELRPNEYDRYRELDMIAFIRKNKELSEDHCDQIEAEIPTNRATPENVAGAAACEPTDWPLDFTGAEEAAGHIKQRFGYKADDQVPWIQGKYT